MKTLQAVLGLASATEAWTPTRTYGPTVQGRLPKSLARISKSDIKGSQQMLQS